MVFYLLQGGSKPKIAIVTISSFLHHMLPVLKTLYHNLRKNKVLFLKNYNFVSIVLKSYTSFVYYAKFLYKLLLCKYFTQQRTLIIFIYCRIFITFVLLFFIYIHYFYAFLLQIRHHFLFIKYFFQEKYSITIDKSPKSNI